MAKSRKSDSFSCSKCSREFGTPQALKCHVLIHNGLKCGERGARLKNEETVENHFAEQHPGKIVQTMKRDEDLECPICTKSFHYPSDVQKHMRTHTGERPFVCPSCPATFTALCYVLDHRRVKHGEKPFECEQCKEKFAKKMELLTHRNECKGEE
ncbi:hypothetical protein PMAYCL1PPCAC_11691 [Pristionchus mayeri]|uniref:C2H2-type domain-containing protein n=1 Tax=Pristionchus mayeri TaxID=1317129 RepID=A0AAN5CGG3_9BILA|nr:hypothetical protein PMAYCL1PPCAC_11691 [Pristionchus mayeri]